MTLRERLGAANRLQQSRGFKIVATIVIAVAAYLVVGRERSRPVPTERSVVNRLIQSYD